MEQLDTAEASLIRTLTRTAREVTLRIEPLLKAEGLTLDGWLVLDALAAGDGLTMTELAGRTLVTGPTLTRVVDRLVTTAAAYREVDVEDRRRVRVYLAPRGRSAHQRASAKLAEVERELDPAGRIRTALGGES
ncbi:MarR family winged helix-turn-helix transcriptional regulator [Amycolatopsis jejuensis]|uniref:MarR family winged helix-turn-helix transcriptional regulator n=1 Tax=Amycolatopsis jejuensis TaxID=330084 RepID=UPI000524AC74|nr:MarR family transcriptional regulator [Amycolatopsis jejuensis]